jgi:hypothetical protein
MKEKTTTSTRYNVLDVRELYISGERLVILICKEWNGYKRRRIEVGPWHSQKLREDAMMLAPGDVILVHDSSCGLVHTIEEIEY